MPSNVLEQFVLQRLPVSPQIEFEEPSLEWSVGGADAQRVFKAPVPFVLRGMDVEKLAGSWQQLAPLLATFGVPVRVSLADNERLAKDMQPLRIGHRFANQFLDGAELQGCDLFALDCRSSDGVSWGWPAELGADLRLRSLVDAVFQASQFETHVGVVLPVGVDSKSLQVCCEAGVSFVTLVDTEPKFSSLSVAGLSGARQAFARYGAPDLPIIFETSLDSVDDFVKCLALGATAISLDCLLAPLIAEHLAKSAPDNSGLLSSIAATSVPGVELLRETGAVLTKARKAVLLALASVGCKDLRQLDQSMLRATTEDAARISGIELLSV